ncbi:MAG: hypothetical protein KF729_05950 [Sandaracinaceae bacterium]|nr:hypothetical protein [Sandaracinaceae bacterium]
MRSFPLALFALSLAACGGGRAEPAEPAPTAASPSVATLEGLARGARDAIDAARGVVFVLFTTDASDADPRADADGRIRTAERACGASLDEALARLGRDLALRFDEPEHRAALECDALRCTFPALGEYDATGELVFVRAGGRVVLDAVARVEGGGATDAFRREGAAFADAERARLAGGGCS